jgi:hypothetical protein
MDNPEKTEGAIKNGQYRENRRGNQEWTIQRKQKRHSRMDNPEKTEETIKNGQSRENLLFSLDCPFLIASSVFSVLSILDCPFCFLWIVHS